MKNFTISIPILSMACISHSLLAGPPPPLAIPVDGGAVALLLAGAAMGLKKIYDRRNENR